MRPVLLIDFGSTFTKVTAVDLDEEVLLGHASAFTTVDHDIGDGLSLAMNDLEKEIGVLQYDYRLACSSAAGGLRMIVSGLVPELTAEAGRLAALGAGAKITRVFTHRLSRQDLAHIEANPPDIFLLAGGTDGGNRAVITDNAEALARLDARFPIIIAGNRDAVDDCEDILSDFETTVCPNVMPRFNKLNIDPVQKAIRSLFLTHIIRARGMTKASSLLSGILMPTPSAVLSAMVLLAKGTKREAGIGELFAIDVGGATTDAYSIAEGHPTDVSVVLKGLEEPYAKRTVEGDIGMRYSATGINDVIGTARLAEMSDTTEEDVKHYLTAISKNKAYVTTIDDPRSSSLDRVLASSAVGIASTRHAGTLEEAYTTSGIVYVQTGKDLRGVRHILLTGGSVIHASDPRSIAEHALFSEDNPFSLRPIEAEIWLDKRYILAAMGVLAERESDIALRLMKKELISLGMSTASHVYTKE